LLQDLKILVLSIVLAFGLWFGGGLLLADQIVSTSSAGDGGPAVVANDDCPTIRAQAPDGAD
jgi:hypothetical protein